MELGVFPNSSVPSSSVGRGHSVGVTQQSSSMSGHHGGTSGASPGREPRRGIGWERWEDDRYHEDATTDPTHTSHLRPTLSGEELRRAGREVSITSCTGGLHP
jgi:hypothetical protein